jgi:glucose-6-phosphate isomerase
MQKELQFGNHEHRILQLVNDQLDKLTQINFQKRLWDHDQSLWTDSPCEEGWTGWLDVPTLQLKQLPELLRFCEEVQEAGFTHAALLGMGGSSLAPLVFQRTHSPAKGLKLCVLDTTDPTVMREATASLPLEKTLFIVSSKSGSTAEIMAMFNHFYGLVKELKGDRAGEQFIAITDKNSPLTKLAGEKGFRKAFINFPGIGGRFSALSNFGIVPAALMGIYVRPLLERAQLMAECCGRNVPLKENPGAVLGALLAVWASRGRDKLTYLIPPSLSTFGWWLEQLLAESTGKHGKGILPLDGYPVSRAEDYGSDRLFFRFGFCKEQPGEFEEKVVAGQPWFGIRIHDPLDIGAEFFRWEIATAVAGRLLGIDPFDQPNVEESKQFTRAVIRQQEEGTQEEFVPALAENGLRFFGAAGPVSSRKLLEQFFTPRLPGDFIVLQAYLPESPQVTKALLELQLLLQQKLHLAVTTQYGPRYLHSTGQYHKGGPDKGFFIQLINTDLEELDIPGQKTGFAALKRAQAIGDHQALAAKGRRTLMIDIGSDITDGLNSLTLLAEKMQAGKVTVKHMHPQEPESDPLQAAS